MNRDELALSNAIVFFDDQVNDLHTLVQTTAPADLVSPEMTQALRTFQEALSRALGVYLYAHGIAAAQRSRQAHPSSQED